MDLALWMHGSGFHGKPTYRTIDDGDKEIEKLHIKCKTRVGGFF